MQAPQLRFIEKNFVQCGLCVKTCPEKALSLVPPAARLHTDFNGLGLARDDAMSETEDHIAYLFEVMRDPIDWW